MAEFADTNEFHASPRLVRQVRSRAEQLGWTCVGGTLFSPDGSVTPLLYSDGHAVACRFTQGGDIVGLHVYCHSADPIASLTRGIPETASSRSLIMAIAEDLGVPL